MRYVSLNPVRAQMVARAEDYAWSSVQAHLKGEDDDLVSVAPALERYGDFATFLGGPVDYDEGWRSLRRAETTGRPLGNADWVAAIEERTGRTLAPQKRGPKPQASALNAGCQLSVFSKLSP